MTTMDGSACRNIIITSCCPPAMKKRDVWRIDHFHLLKKIGSGYASTVYLATCRMTGNQVAVKLYHKNKLSELNFFQVSREIRIHSSLDHKNIIQLWAAFEDQYGIYLVTEFASKGDVFADVEKRGGQMSEAETVRQVLHPFLMALIYLHELKIMHRDIKPENLLFTATGVLKVADFGLSINFEAERPVTRVGTLDYMAPEVVVCPDKHKPNDHKDMKHLYYTPVVDAWAVGVLAYELIIGRPPFDKGHKKLTIAEIVNGEPNIPSFVSEGAAGFIRWSLTKDQRRRPSVQQMIDHPWIASHMKQPLTRRADALRVFGRTESFVEPRSMLMSAAGAVNASDSISGPEEVVHHLQVQALQHSGRMLGHSSSMNATDMMRWRDIAFNADPETTYDLPGNIELPKRMSDGIDSRPSSRRQSQATGLNSPRAMMAANGLSRNNSGHMVQPGGAGAQDAYNARQMSREELFQSLQASAQKLSKSVSFGRQTSSPTAPASPGRTPVPASGGGGSPSAVSPSAYQRGGMLQRSHSLHMHGQGTSPLSPPQLAAQPRTCNSNSPSRYAPVRQQSSHAAPSRMSAETETVIQDLSRLCTESEGGRPPTHRPQPPVQAAYARYFTPSRLGSSFTAPSSPSHGSPLQQGGAAARTTLMRSPTPPDASAGVTGSVSPRSNSLSYQAKPGSPVLPDGHCTGRPYDQDADAVMSEADDPDAPSLMKSAKGILGGLKKVFS